MVGVTHRQARWDEEPMVRAIARRCGKFVSTYSGIRDLRSYYDKGWVVITSLDGEPVGFCVTRHNVRNPWSTIYEFGVVPEAQRRGIGSQMIGFQLATTPHHRLRLVCDQDNDQAYWFYAALGFSALGVRHNRSGEAIVDMELIG